MSDFKFFGWDEDPIGKYKQPEACEVPNTGGYPVSDVGKDDVMVKGRWPAGTKMKGHMDIRGTGAATKGKQMTLDPDAGD